ncbi:raffinose/stachyose/melibiose transport system substrate-binding protein [Curtobacterium luteum]|uniref:Raffinose/stachyose/melibiose transport system substrate-binding protein n=1 Tax=Curtobacterium luteum TaxID=33881 RepID=A0A8H9GEM7_9MICO|nr:extracellular solute-binding protein [Curtobacterium luteum]MBM7801318.1 raffinose/stachyose/melibiose transport system substrate-binding protein [Curtobacterium luteum]NUU49997.1 extracellular solute-binding protein [Curtobacterium luteum]GGL12643.1 sugar ABC transporter substrate-binding protein [Curtobacterium luteum]
MKHSSKATLLLGVAAAVAIGLTGCTPGGSAAPAASQSLGPVSKDVGSGKTTLTVWDQNTDTGINDAQQELNDEFEKAHPNITIKRVSRSFADLKTTLKLALSGNNPPDVVQANQGYPDMGAFVKAGFLRPVDDYAKLYGWDSYYPSSLLKLNSFSSDGKTWQGDDLYGVSQTGELVGLYYNKAVLRKAGIDSPPKTVAELTEDMQQVKASGTLPLSYGDVEKSPGIHLYGLVLSALAGHDAVNDLVAGKSGSWTGSDEVQAAKTITGWVDKGYVTEGANGVSRDDAVAAFGKGQSAFLITGTWYQATLEAAASAKDIGFTALTPDGASGPVTMGGEGLAWAITSKTGNANAAAAYIDFVTNKDAAKVLVDKGNLPTVVPDGDSPASGTIAGDITSEYESISSSNSITPYLDYATPTFYDTITAAMQDLVAGKASPEQYTKTLQDDYAGFVKQ